MFEKTIETVQNYVKNNKLSSIEIAIGDSKNVYLVESYGKTSFLENAIQVDENTLYDMASISKIISTLLITLRFIDRKILKLDDTLDLFFNEKVPIDKKSITLRHLLTHTAGFQQIIVLENEINSPSKTLDYLLNLKLEYEPGTNEIYDDASFILLGLILEKISGKSLDNLILEEVVKPLNLKNTSYNPLLNKDQNKENIVVTEKRKGSQEWIQGTVHDENTFFLNGIAGHAGVFSNIQDLITIIQMLINNGKFKDKTYLSSETIEMAIKNYTEGFSENRGLGFKLNSPSDQTSLFNYDFDPNSYGHTGFTGPHFVISPKTNLFLIILTNRVHPNRNNENHILLREELSNSVPFEYMKLKSKF